MYTPKSWKTTSVNRVNKRFFTLIEILIVLSCILMFAGFFTVNIRQALNEQTFIAETNELLSQIQLAQDLNALFGIDLDMEFVEENGVLKTKLIPTGVITESFDQLLKNSEKQYRFTVEWEGKGFRNQKTFKLGFYDRGYHPPLGVVKIKGEKELYLPLYGYPHPLHYSEELVTVQMIEQKNMALYDLLTPYIHQDPHVIKN